VTEAVELVEDIKSRARESHLVAAKTNMQHDFYRRTSANASRMSVRWTRQARRRCSRRHLVQQFPLDEGGSGAAGQTAVDFHSRMDGSANPGYDIRRTSNPNTPTTGIRAFHTASASVGAIVLEALSPFEAFTTELATTAGKEIRYEFRKAPWLGEGPGVTLAAASNLAAEEARAGEPLPAGQRAWHRVMEVVRQLPIRKVTEVSVDAKGARIKAIASFAPSDCGWDDQPRHGPPAGLEGGII